ncbi:MAG: hypothetical protein JWP44_487 [Mucilaginibacter sp.]|nr:hypothetical protein [Mucilaginibacter sp.]
MEETKPLNSVHSISLFKKILLYFNVSAFRVASANPIASNFRKNYYSGQFSAAMVAVSEYGTAKLMFPHLASSYPLFILVFGLFFHAFIDILFAKDIIVMAGNYNAYYNKILFYIFLIFLSIGLVEGLITFNNHIGHVK